MARIDLNIPSLGGKFTDIRDVLPGDSFNWSWIRSLSQVKYLAIHHSGGPDSQTPDEIANYHINSNGWGGIGYHFLIAKDGTVYYVGDIATARANVANLNEQVIGICLIGNFTSGNLPSNEQLISARNLCDFFINNFPDLVNITGWDAVKGHKELPNQATVCPGDSWPSWRPKIVESDSVISSEANVNTKLQDQIENLQATLLVVNQQVFSLQQVIQQKDQEINLLKERLAQTALVNGDGKVEDSSLTIIGALVNLYKFIFPPRLDNE